MPNVPLVNVAREPFQRLAGRSWSPVARYDRPPSQALVAAMDEALLAVAALQTLGPAAPAGFARTLEALEGLASARLAGVARPLWLLEEQRLRGREHVHPLRSWQEAERATAVPPDPPDGDLAAFIGRRDLPVLLQAGIAVAQAATMQRPDEPDGVAWRAGRWRRPCSCGGMPRPASRYR